MACELRLDDLPDDTLKHVFHYLSTDARRTISRTSHKWQRLVADCWNFIDIRLGGTNYLDSASLQIKWLLSLRLQHLQSLQLNLKGVELSGVAVDYLLGPFLDVLEQGSFLQLKALDLAADMSLPGPLIHAHLQHLQLDMYALTAVIQCPQLLTLTVRTVSMPGPTLFSREALLVFQQLQKLQLTFQSCYFDDPKATWFVLEGLHILTALQHVTLKLPNTIHVDLTHMPALPVALTHLELDCSEISLSTATISAVDKLDNCLLISQQICLVTLRPIVKVEKFGCPLAGSRVRYKSGAGPFVHTC